MLGQHAATSGGCAVAVAEHDVKAAQALGRWVGPAALALTILLLGANWPVMKIALQTTTALWMACFRLLFAGVLYAVLLAALRRLTWPARRDWPVVLTLGVCQGALMTGLVTMGVGLAGAGRSAILAYTSPIWVIPFAVLVFKEKVTRWQIAGLVLGVAGLLVMFNPAGFDWHNGRVVLGNVCVLLGSAAMAVAQLAARGHVWSVPPLQTMPFQTLLGGLILLPAAMLLEGPVPTYSLEPGFLAALAYAAAGATFVAYWTMVEAARRLPAGRMALAQLITPVWGVAASAIWAAEVPVTIDLIGLALILSGVAVSSAGAPRRRVPA